MEYHNTYVLYVAICTIMLCYVTNSYYQLIGTQIYIYIYIYICYYMLVYVIISYFVLLYVIICHYMLLYVIVCYYILLYIVVFTYGDAQWFLYMGIQRDFFLMGYIIILYQTRLLPTLKSPIVCIYSLFFVDILHYLMFFVVHSEAFSIRNTDRLVVGAHKAICFPKYIHYIDLKQYWPFAVHTQAFSSGNRA